LISIGPGGDWEGKSAVVWRRDVGKFAIGRENCRGFERLEGADIVVWGEGRVAVVASWGRKPRRGRGVVWGGDGSMSEVGRGE
jgi:hypothetical protein